MSYLYVCHEALICVKQRIRAPEHTCLRVHIRVYIHMRHIASNVASLIYMRHTCVTQHIRAPEHTCFCPDLEAEGVRGGVEAGGKQVEE